MPSALIHNPALSVYTNFNAIDQIELSLAEITTLTRQKAQVSFLTCCGSRFCELRGQCEIKKVFAAQPNSIVRELEDCVPGYETFVAFRAIGCKRDVAGGF